MIDASEHIGLVYSVVKRMRLDTDDTDELIGAGMVALVRAANGFDPTKGYRFSTYAVQAIRNSVIREWQTKTMPTKGLSRQSQMTDAVLAGHGRPDPEPTLDSDDELRHQQDLIAGLLVDLTDRQREVVLMRMVGMTNTEIAKRFGSNRHSISNTYNTAVVLMRERAMGAATC